MMPKLSRVLWGAAACSVLAGCGGGRESAAEVPDTATLDSIAGDTLFVPTQGRTTLPTDRIYHTLTSYEWYARGEPLVHDGRSYSPGGAPIEAAVTEMELAGEFQGVEYYVREGNEEPAVFVPVFPGYWQTFRAGGPATSPAAEPTDTSQ